MRRDWSQAYELIYKHFMSTEHAKTFGDTKIGLARFLGMSQGKTQKWEKGQWPAADDLAVLAEKLGCDYRWLVTGEGEPFGTTQATPPVRRHTSPIPVLGLASCGVEGWNQVMPISVSSTLPVSKSMVAVIAAGESMVPAGIAPGHICYCDPEQEAISGDAAYVVRKDGLATIKLFFGTSERGEGWIRFKGWLAPNGERTRDFFMDIMESEITTMAPVIFVRRRI